MTAIRFPNSVGIGTNNNSRTDRSRIDLKGPRRIVTTERGSDVIEISSEAQIKFEKDNLVRLEKVKLLKEAKNYLNILAEDIKFKEADQRNVYRPGRIFDTKDNISAKFYEFNEEFVLRKMLDKPEV